MTTLKQELAQALTALPLNQLRVDEKSNVRRTGRGAQDDFVASIRSMGVQQPLIVRPNGKGHVVIDGGKRLAALQALQKEGALPADHPIPVIIIKTATDAEARDMSLTLNIVRENMHPVDEFEAFAALANDGMLPTDIGKRYGISEKIVMQRLALGNLAPVIRDAWRDDKIDDEAATAFTLETDQKRQTELFKALKKRGGLHRHSIRTAISGDERQAEAMLRFVGIDAYKTAGGATTQDLFADKNAGDVIATDFKLLAKLYDEKLKAKVAELKAEGWQWVTNHDDLPQDAYWWPSKAKNDVKAEHRGKYGVIVKIGYNKEVEFKYGVSKPENKTTANAKAAKKSGTSVISAALADRLSDQITKAAAAVVKTDFHLSLALIATACMTDHAGGVCIEHNGDRKGMPAKFAPTLEIMRKKKPAELQAVLAELVSTALDLGGAVQDRLPLNAKNDSDRALLHALDQKKLNAQLRANFDAVDYFNGVGKTASLDAIKTCDPKQPLTGKEKKGELAKIAAKLVKDSNASGKAGYLPPEMRTAHYDGPTSRAVKANSTAKPKALTKAKPAKKAKRK